MCELIEKERCCAMGRRCDAGEVWLELRRLVRDRSGQGTTEYAILVGVLVVIAIVAIIAFRDKVAELWEAIASGINSL